VWQVNCFGYFAILNKYELILDVFKQNEFWCLSKAYACKEQNKEKDKLLWGHTFPPAVIWVDP
jgi:hypothetical protein